MEDRRLKWTVSQTLMESGAEVYTAATKQDIQLMVEAIGLDLILVAVPLQAEIREPGTVSSLK